MQKKTFKRTIRHPDLRLVRGFPFGQNPSELTEKSQERFMGLLSKVFIWAFAETFAR